MGDCLSLALMPFLVAEDKIIEIHDDKFQRNHLLKKFIIQYIQETQKYALTDDFQIFGNQIHRLLRAQLRGVNAEVKVIRLTPFLS